MMISHILSLFVHVEVGSYTHGCCAAVESSKGCQLKEVGGGADDDDDAAKTAVWNRVTSLPFRIPLDFISKSFFSVRRSPVPFI